MTDTNGDHKISTVTADNFILVASKEYPNGKFVSTPIDLEVNGDIILDPIILPDPVTLFPAADVSSSAIN